jgi:hypothetical protein
MTKHTSLAVGLVVASLAGAASAAPAPVERRLHVASAEASSYLVNDWNKFQENYLPLYVGDDDPKTAWTLKTEGIGEWLRVHVTPMAGASKVRLKIRNGYQKTDKLWAANSRAKGLTVVLLPSQKTVDVELTDKQGWQEIAVDQPAGALEAVELRVRSVYPGKKYDDLCLSDVQLFVTATSSENPAFEKQRLQRILDWKKDRVAAAALFKSELGKALPIASQYLRQSGAQDEADNVTVDDKACRDDLCWMHAKLVGFGRSPKVEATPELAAATEAARARFAGLTAVRVSTRDKRPLPAVDGICTPRLDACSEDTCYEHLPLPAQMGYLNAQSLVTTEQSGLPSVDEVLDFKPAACKRREASTFAWIARAPAAADGTPGAVRTMLLVECGLVDGREESYPRAIPQLLVYGADGALDLYAGQGFVEALTWTGDPGARKLARTTRLGDFNVIDRFEAATAVAGK